MASVIEIPKRRKLTWRTAMTKTRQAAQEMKSEWQMWARTLLVCLTFIGAAVGFAYWLGGEFESMRTAARADRDLMLRIAAASVQAAEERMMVTDVFITAYTDIRDKARTVQAKREADAVLDKLNSVRKTLTKPYFPELEQQKAGAAQMPPRQQR